MNVEKVRDRFLFQTNCTRQTAPGPRSYHRPLEFWPRNLRSSAVCTRSLHLISGNAAKPYDPLELRELLLARSMAGFHFYLEHTKCEPHRTLNVHIRNVRITRHRLVRSPNVKPWKFPGLYECFKKRALFRPSPPPRNLTVLFDFLSTRGAPDS